MRNFYFFHPFGGAANLYTSLPAAVAWHPLREWERASHNQLLPCGRRRDWGQELEQVQKPVAPLDRKAHAQGQRHRFLAQRRHESGASCSPKRTFQDRKSTRLNSSHVKISYAVFCLKKKRTETPL